MLTIFLEGPSLLVLLFFFCLHLFLVVPKPLKFSLALQLSLLASIFSTKKYSLFMYVNKQAHIELKTRTIHRS